MEQWARGSLLGGKNIDFLCICVDTLSCAKNFGRLFSFSKAINGWIKDPSDMPSFGQLGCSGFIIMDGKGGCISKQTLPFLRHGEAAFQNVKELLVRSLKIRPSPSQVDAASAEAAAASGYSVGSIVVLEGLKSSPELNGVRAKVLGFDTAKGRFTVTLLQEDSSRGPLAVLPCCIAPLTTSTQGASVPGPSAAPLSSIHKPNATGCRPIDTEHGQCTEALNALLRTPTSTAALHHTLCVLEEHFSHEEEILTGAGFGENGAGAAFSALTGHSQDHARILSLGRAGLENAVGGAVREEVSWSLAQAFVDHARDFDSLFEGKIRESGEEGVGL